MEGVIRFICDTLYALVNIESAVYDKKYLKVKNSTYLILSALSIASFYIEKRDTGSLIEECLLSVAAVLPILLFATMTDGMGGGDVKYIFFNMLYLGAQEEINALIVCFVVLSVYKIKKRKQGPDRRIPLLPFMMIGNIIMLIITRI